MVLYPAPNHRWASKVIVRVFLGLMVRAASKMDIPEMTTELPVNDMAIGRKVVVGSDKGKERLKVGKGRGQRRRCSSCCFPGVYMCPEAGFRMAIVGWW